MQRLRTRSRGTAALAVSIALAACDTVGRATAPTVDPTVIVNVAGLGAPIATIAIEVSAPDIVPALVFNLTIAGDVASGRLSIPAGTSRTLTARAFDSAGEITHEGSVTLDLEPGANPSVSIAMIPRAGEQPIAVHVGPVTVAVTPATATLGVGATRQLGATVAAADGTILPVVVEWASANPARATIGPAGVVTGVTPGVTNVVATFGGAAGLCQVTIQ